MKLNRKLLVLAKGISVWWGIYLILGCCAGFAVRMVQTLFMMAEPLDIFGGGLDIEFFLHLADADDADIDHMLVPAFSM